MTNKVFRTLDQQVEILKQKGLIIQDEQKTKDILLRENYFFINGYRHFFTIKGNKDKFIEGTKFEELYATFTFDRRIRNTFFKNILIVENNIKSIISYQLSKKYGFRDKDYLNPKNYTQDKLATRQVKDVLNKVKRQLRINGRKHAATLHYIDNYGYVPMWILVKVLSFGIMTEFYDILKPEDKKAIADFYNIDSDTMDTYLAILSNFRNVCAHEDILYDHKIQRLIPDTKYHEQLKIPKTKENIYIYGKNDLFAVVIILKILLTKPEFNEMMEELKREVKHLDDKIDTIPLSAILSKIGFPDNWQNLENM